LQIYGFTLDENPYDSFPLYLQTSTTAPNYPRKEEVMRKAGLSIAQTTVHVFKSDPSKSLDTVLQYLRIQRADSEETMSKIEETLGAGAIDEETENALIRSLLQALKGTASR
jgi:uncharacterized protein YbcC (UPF0753/DUF2309 family)